MKSARTAAIKEQMGELSRLIGEARKAGQSPDVLVARMSVLSAEHKSLEECRKVSKIRSTNTTIQEPQADPRGTQRCRSREPKTYPEPRIGTGAIEFKESVPSPAEWNEYVLSHPRASPYHLHCWKRILEASFVHPAHWLVARRADGHLAGVLPMIRQKSRLFGHFMTSMPFLNYGGPLGDSAEVESGLMESAGRLAAGLGCRHVEFREELARPDWPARSNKVSMRLPLPETREKLWSDFPGKLRSQLRRAEREGPRATIGGAELLPDFYNVFARNMRDLGTPVYSRRFFERIFELSNTPVWVAAVHLGGVPVSAGLLVEFRNRMEIPWASTVREALPMGINMHFYWQVLCFAIERGMKEFDFGRSTLDSGPYRFKKQWGATEKPLHWHYWLPKGAAVPSINPGNPRFKLMIAAWKRLPLGLANAIGPRIARSLP